MCFTVLFQVPTHFPPPKSFSAEYCFSSSALDCRAVSAFSTNIAWPWLLNWFISRIIMPFSCFFLIIIRLCSLAPEANRCSCAAVASSHAVQQGDWALPLTDAPSATQDWQQGRTGAHESVDIHRPPEHGGRIEEARWGQHDTQNRVAMGWVDPKTNTANLGSLG